METPPPFTFARGLSIWWRESVRLRGFWGALASLGVSVYEVARDYTPARRRLRYGDLEYDWEHKVDTTWSNLRLGTRVREIFAGRQYQPIEADLFRDVIGGLEVDYSQFTFIDLGSGKGRALLLATEFPFRCIIGVELLPELHAIAHQNVGKYQQGSQRSRVELFCGDARQFCFPPEALVVFLFDPFPEHVLQEVIDNLEQSLSEQPRPALVVYLNPISEHVLSNTDWLQRLRGNIQYAVYYAKDWKEIENARLESGAVFEV
jgi:SAM-dependent methyltransferase